LPPSANKNNKNKKRKRKVILFFVGECTTPKKGYKIDYFKSLNTAPIPFVDKTRKTYANKNYIYTSKSNIISLNKASQYKASLFILPI